MYNPDFCFVISDTISDGWVCSENTFYRVNDRLACSVEEPRNSRAIVAIVATCRLSQCRTAINFLNFVNFVNFVA